MYNDKVSEIENAFDIGPSVIQTVTVSGSFLLLSTSFTVASAVDER